MDRRVQLLLDEDRYRRVAAHASERGTSMAVVIREAIDRGLPSSEGRRTDAARRILDADDMPVPDITDLVAELDDQRSRRTPLTATDDPLADLIAGGRVSPAPVRGGNLPLPLRGPSATDELLAERHSDDR